MTEISIQGVNISSSVQTLPTLSYLNPQPEVRLTQRQVFLTRVVAGSGPPI